MAGSNMYLKFEAPAIAGGSSAPGHAGEIDVLSWSHGFVQPTSPTRETTDQASHQNLSFTKYVDSASAELLKICWSGRQIGKATLTCHRDAGGSVESLYLSVVMEHVIISNISVSGGPGNVPVENISLDYGIVSYKYVQQNGTTEASHNLKTREVR